MNNHRGNTTEPNSGVAQTRQHLQIMVGEQVQKDGTVYRISQVLDFETVIGIAVESGRSCPLRIKELVPLNSGSVPPELDMSEIGDADWREAEHRFSIIKPLVDRHTVGRDAAEERAKQTGVDTATIYRWLKRYKATGSVLALIPQKPGWKKGKSRIPAHAEAVIQEVIKEVYLTLQRPSAQKAVQEVMRRCHERRIDPPSPGTVRARLRDIPERDRLRGHGFREKAINKFQPAAGKFPNADYPLAVMQIDHTPADIILVDDVYRKPIGRPWITLAMDVCTRMVTGYYLSFDPPSETSVGMCVAQSMLPKDEWLLLHNVEAEWPVWGTPATIHVDNGPDFRSETFRRSCLAYGINLEFRPVKQPRYGGHIERVLGSLLKEIHNLPGTTFSSIKEKEGYDPEKHAAMTKSEFEEWLVTLICKVYHQRLHSGIGMSPMKKWEIGVFGNADVQGVGLAPRPADRLSVLLDFLPSFQRTIQTFGVTIDGMNYYDEALRPWINAKDPDTPDKKRTFVFRRDPRDISVIWFKDPDLGHYFRIPFANLALPSMSVWEYAQAKARLRQEGRNSVNESEILRAISELRTHVEESQARTKRSRRQAQRRKEHEKKVTPADPLLNAPSTAAPQESPAKGNGLLTGDIDVNWDIA
ncbi:Mu transposase C-terminal domain-containing protein [Vreelandella neptunia]|uniref:DDE-type integrase/transposase/recombinase n=1 Tax=Vreelandella neptunia TaxID=115551 RepID=A0ABZ0YM91_9GAMM|nr:Mu transposase C-terminal domain-containing protein [Halomonas neptunia]MDN3560459.1 DDE-type integrase/transposase/recombinase [Halomonas neptunia]WQH12619.1 DDE-type integrase/transposase/recombinase [Halomonas neptunia]